MKLKDGFELTQVSESLYIAKAVGENPTGFPGMQMGFTGGYLWDKLSKEDCTEEQLADALENLFEEGADRGQVAADVKLFVDFLRQNGLLDE